MDCNQTSFINAATAAAAAGTIAACAAGVKSVSAPSSSPQCSAPLLQSEPSRRLQCRRAIEVMRKADSRTVHQLCIYECQRWLPVSDWDCDNLHFYERAPMCHDDGEGSYERDPKTGSPLVELPSGWIWCDSWKQRGGWEYAFNFFSGWSNDVRWFCKVRRRKWIRTVCLQIEEPVEAPELVDTTVISKHLGKQLDKREKPPPVKAVNLPWKKSLVQDKSSGGPPSPVALPSPAALTPRRRANTWSPGPSSPSPFPAAALVKPSVVVKPDFPAAAVIQLPKLPKAAIAIPPAPAEADTKAPEPVSSHSAPAQSSMTSDSEMSLYL